MEVVLRQLARFGFRGPVYPVNPKRAEVQGLRTVARLADLPGAPDHVVIAVPGEAAGDAL